MPSTVRVEFDAEGGDFYKDVTLDQKAFEGDKGVTKERAECVRDMLAEEVWA